MAGRLFFKQRGEAFGEDFPSDTVAYGAPMGAILIENDLAVGVGLLDGLGDGLHVLNPMMGADFGKGLAIGFSGIGLERKEGYLSASRRGLAH